MKSRLKRTGIIALALILSYFGFRTYRIGSKDWKYCSGSAILGDSYSFDFSLVSIFTDKLYCNGEPCVKLINYSYRILDDQIQIESLEGEQRGIYCSK